MDYLNDSTTDGGFHYKRLVDLNHPSNSHLWLWNISEIPGGAITDQDEFAEAVRVRLGCGGPRDPTVCAACGVTLMDGTGRHSSTCCIGEATRGRNRCVEVLFQYAKVVDPEAEMEPRALVPARDRLRPADLLTTAACRLTAADSGVTSPAVASSAEAAKEAMFNRKTAERIAIETDLRRQGIQYAPMVASHFGSLHGGLDCWLKQLAKAVSRRRGLAVTAVE